MADTVTYSRRRLPKPELVVTRILDQIVEFPNALPMLSGLPASMDSSPTLLKIYYYIRFGGRHLVLLVSDDVGDCWR